MNFSGWTLITDLDGTLLDDNKKISEKNLFAIDYFKKNQGKFAVATGRALRRIGMYRDILKTDIPSIFLNGSSIIDMNNNDKEIWARYMDESAVTVAKDIYKKHPEWGLEIYANNTNYFINVTDLIKGHMKAEGFEQNFCTLDEVPKPWQKIFISSRDNILPIIQEDYNKYNNIFDFTRSDNIYYEVLGKNINKGNALKKLISEINLDKSKTICVGDNLNDLEFIKEAGIGVTVENACNELKKNADIILCNNNESAIYDLIFEKKWC